MAEGRGGVVGLFYREKTTAISLPRKTRITRKVRRNLFRIPFVYFVYFVVLFKTGISWQKKNFGERSLQKGEIAKFRAVGQAGNDWQVGVG
jgi:hypothetical protein